jgi:7-carboxy-7-deazaguanine synthase
MRIAEIYHSVQGEGLLTGTASVFVRASGCNLRCSFCDTPFASWHPEGEDRAVEEIVAQVAQWPCGHVVLTGGEPMLFAELVPLCGILRGQGWHITIETAGTLYLPLACDLMSISPKLANSTPADVQAPGWHARHERTRQAAEIVSRLIQEYPYQLKFVVGTPAAAAEALDYLEQFPAADPRRVLLMPQATDWESHQQIADWLQPFCRRQGLQYGARRQLQWFGLVRGT